MKLIVCLDDHNGMAFNHRRQSKDRVLQERIVSFVGKSVLRMNGYSEKQFFLKPDMLYVNDDYLDTAEAEDYCFVETDDVTSYLAKANEVAIFRWNRRYPADLYFPMDRLRCDFQKISTADFQGNSHETITQEVYSR